MLGQAPWARLSPSGPAVLLLVICAGMTTQDLCRSPGDLPAPALMLNTFSAQEGQRVLVQCAIDGHFPVTRIVFCKDGVEMSSLKAIQGQLNYNMMWNVSLGSTGKYTCGYQLKDQSNQVKNSALSVPQDLAVTGPAMPLEVWILRSALSLLLLLSAPIITLLLERCSHGAHEAKQPGDIPVPMEL